MRGAKRAQAGHARAGWWLVLVSMLWLAAIAPAYAQSCTNPVVAPPTLPNGTLGTPYSQTVTASAGTPSYNFSVSAGSLPTGLTLSGGGALTGTPTTAGPFNFTITAVDQTGCPGSRAYTVSIAPPVLVAPATLPNGQVNVAYNQTISASGGNPPFTFAVTAGTLPAGLALSSGGTLSGTPNTPGTYGFTITAIDTVGATGSQAYSVTIAANIVIAPPTLPNGQAGVAYNQTLSASGGTAPYTFAVTAGALPAGMTLSPTGILSGAPTVAGSYNFTVTATDANTANGSQAYTLVIAAPNIVIAPPTLPNGAGGTAYSQTLSATGGVAPYSFAISGGALPPGLSLTSAGLLGGTPTTSGTFNFTVTATDVNGFTGSQAYALTISAPAITLAPATLPDGTAGSAYAQLLSASGGAAPYAFAVSAGSLPPGLVLAPDGRLSGTPTTPGTFGFTVTASDANGFTGSHAYNLTIQIPGGVPVAVSRQVGTLQDVPVQVDLTAGASGGPFVSAGIVSVTPAGSATVASSGGTYTLTFTPAPGFIGVASVVYTLSSQYATSAPATITVNVAARPDPTRDPGVVGLQLAQDAAVRRFMETQVLNVRSRLETMHDPSDARWGWWIGGTARSGDRKADPAVSAQAFDVAGMTVGIDRRFGGRFAFGGGLGYDHDRTNVGVAGTRSNARALSGVLYGHFNPKGAFYVDTSAGHQRLTFQLRRRVAQTQALVESPRDGVQDFSSTTAGYDYRRKHSKTSVYLRLDAAQARLGDYTEQGDDVFALHSDGQSGAGLALQVRPQDQLGAVRGARAAGIPARQPRSGRRGDPLCRPDGRAGVFPGAWWSGRQPHRVRAWRHAPDPSLHHPQRRIPQRVRWPVRQRPLTDPEFPERRALTPSTGTATAAPVPRVRRWPAPAAATRPPARCDTPQTS